MVHFALTGNTKWYNSMFDTEREKYSAAASKIQNIIDVFISKINLGSPDFHGGLIDAQTTQDLIDAYIAFINFKNCLEVE